MIAKIEKGVPIPDDVKGRKKYPFSEMEIGDSFVCQNAHGNTYAYSFSRLLGKKFIARKIESDRHAWRIWRVA